MSDLTDSLDRIMKWIELKHPKAINFFDKGLTNQEIDLIFKSEFPFSPSSEIYEFYGWRNGQIDSYSVESDDVVSRMYYGGEASFFDGMTLVALMSLDYFNFDPLWLVIAENEDCYILVIDLRNSNILKVDVKGGSDESYIIYKNLTTMAQTLAEFYESGGDVDGVIDFSKDYQRVWLKYNSEIGEEAIQKVLENRT